MTTYTLISTKGNRTVEGTETEAIAAAQAMHDELQPAYGVTVEDEDGETVAEIGTESEETEDDSLPVVDVRDITLRFLTPPRNQGQIVEVSYAGLYDGRVLCKTYDQSDRSTSYAVADLSPDDPEETIGLNDEPMIEGEWKPCRIRE
jgi:hypothetical protein